MEVDEEEEDEGKELEEELAEPVDELEEELGWLEEVSLLEDDDESEDEAPPPQAHKVSERRSEGRMKLFFICYTSGKFSTALVELLRNGPSFLRKEMPFFAPLV